MNVNKVLMATVPVVLGVFVAGLIMNALRDNDFVKNAIDGFDG